MRDAAPFVAGEVSLPLMRVFREEVARKLSSLEAVAGRGLRWAPEWDGRSVGRAGPEVLLSLGYDTRFGRTVQARGFDTGRYRAPVGGMPHPAFRAMEGEDPCGRVALYAGTPFVMLVDHRRLGPIPAPRRWADLLEDDFHREIAAPGNELGISSIVLLHYRLRHGAEGMARFARQVRTCAHGSRLARAACESAATAAVSIVPWIFAECARGVDTEVVWPEEGALLSPMWISVREDAGKEAREFSRYLTGQGFGSRVAPFFCPWADKAVEGPALPEGARFDWPGWDVLDAVDMEGYCAQLRIDARRARHRAKGVELR